MHQILQDQSYQKTEKLITAALIITTYNRPDALNLVLNSLAHQTMTPTEVVIADDGSDHKTLDVVNRHKNVFGNRLLHSWQEDVGFRAAMSRNKAIAKTSADYVIVIDGDMVLHPSFIEDHVHFAKRGTFVQGSRAKLSDQGTLRAITAGKFRFKTLDPDLKSRRYGIRSDILKLLFSGAPLFDQVSMLQTCNMAFFRSDFIAVNGFNEDFEGWGREDTEFGIRLLNSGVRRRNLKFSAIAYHLHHDGESRASLPRNDQILEETVRRRATWCENGFNKYNAERAKTRSQ